VNEAALSQYRQFLERVSELFSQIHSRHASAMKCALGCHSCCKPGLTVSRIEAENIRAFLRGREEDFLAREKSARKDRCSFLDPDGACGIYEARPVVCRSHGAPIQFKDPESRGKDPARFRDVCDLNFKGLNLTELPATDFMNLDTVNTLLAVLNQGAYGKENSRTPLTPSGILKA
jgi:Fe-S-cluster containining protein